MASMSQKTDYKQLLLNFIVTLIFFSSFVLLPVLVVQGLWVRKRVPRLPDASGPHFGAHPGEDVFIRILGIGESTVAGVGVADHSLALTGQIAKAISDQHNRGVKWYALGKNGATVQKGLKELAPLIPDHPVDYVILAFGVNDILEFSSTKRWVQDLTQLISEVRNRLGSVPIFLAGVPPMGYFPGIPQPLRAILGLRASILEREAFRLSKRLDRVIYCLHTVQFEKQMFATDQVHPSALGYEIWGRQIANQISKLGHISKPET